MELSLVGLSVAVTVAVSDKNDDADDDGYRLGLVRRPESCV